VSKRQRKAKQKPPAQPKSLSEYKAVYVSTYEITSEPIVDRRYKRLPEHVKDAIDRLHHLAQRQPLEAIPELLEWIEKYPDVLQLYNFLSVAYSQSGQQEKAEEVILENYRRNPDYLFARLNYAEICLRKSDLDRVAEIFDNKFDLKMLYPKRKRFHISEVASFMGIIGIYFVEIGEPEAAEKYYDILKQIAPRYPATRALHRKLHPGFLQRLLHRLAMPPESGL
jgi:tetratricopeptide (TPR) repeat protein